MKFVFFSRPKPRQFNYKPIYYDPAKEEAEVRRKSRSSLQAGDPREHLRSEIRRKWKIDRSETDKKNKLIRIVFYIIIAAFSIYIIFFTDLINKLVSLFLQ
jgi:hypothetical protein